MDTSNVTRVEVIDHTMTGKGRSYFHWEEDSKVELSLQDEGRTLKVFIRSK